MAREKWGLSPLVAWLVGMVDSPWMACDDKYRSRFVGQPTTSQPQHHNYTTQSSVIFNQSPPSTFNQPHHQSTCNLPPTPQLSPSLTNHNHNHSALAPVPSAGPRYAPAPAPSPHPGSAALWSVRRWRRTSAERPRSAWNSWRGTQRFRPWRWGTTRWGGEIDG